MVKARKQVRRSKVHRSLLHHSHSWRLVHHKHTHYPTMFFLMLVCGVLLAGMTTVTRAATLNVRATVLGDPPAYAADITKPKNNQRFTEIPIAVEGTCPPDSIVKIYRNDVFSGSAICSGSNTFSLMSDLFEGKNKLIARVFNLAEVEGPVSDEVVVYYDKPADEPPISTGDGELVKQLFIDSELLYRGYFVGQEIVVPVEIGGDQPAYGFNVDWGDGTNDVSSINEPKTFDTKHTYSKPGNEENSSYTIVHKASDTQGGKAYHEIVIIVSDYKSTVTTTTTDTDADALSFWENLYKQVLVMWPVYITTSLMLGSFWLGQWQGYNSLWHRLFRGPRRLH